MAKHSSSGPSSPVRTPLAQTPGIAEYSLKLWDDRPAAFTSHIFRNVCFFLYAVLALDGIAAFALNQSLKNFFQKLGWSNVGSNSMKATYDSITQFSIIFSSCIADERLGKFKTLFGAATFDLVGFTMLVIASLPKVVSNQGLAKVLFCIGLFLGVAPSNGSMNTLTLAYGGDQFSPDISAQKKALYFSGAHFVNSFGSAFSYAIFPTLSTRGLGPIPASWGYTANFVSGLLCVVGMVTILFTTRKRYVNLPPTKNSVTQVMKVMLVHSKTNWRARFVVLGTVLYVSAFCLNVLAAILSDHGETGYTLSKAAGALVLIATAIWVSVGRDQSFVETAKESYGGKFDDEFIDGVKKVVRVLPLYAFNVVWWMCQNQRGNNQTIIQQTDVRLGRGPNASQIPGPTVQMFNPLAVLFFVPITEKFVFPLYAKRFGKPPSRYGKILTGYFIAALGMVWAGCFEMIRRSRPLLTYVAADGATKLILNTDGHQPMSDIPWYAALPQYFLVSLAGVFIYIPTYDLCYNEVPRNMAASSLALNAFSSSMGSTLLSAVLLWWRKYIPANLNNGHMEYMHFTLCAIMLVNIFFYVIVMNQTKLGMLPKVDKAKDEDDQSSDTTESANA